MGAQNLKPLPKQVVSKEEMQAYVQKISPTHFLSYREFLAELYRSMKEARESYSYHQFALDLGFSKSNVLWLVVAGKRKLTPMTSQKLADGLYLHGVDREYLLTLVKYNHASRPDVREEAFAKLLRWKKKGMSDEKKQKDLEYYSAWYYPVIREMVDLPNFQNDPVWIASQFNVKITPKQVELALAFLTRIGLITYDQKTNNYVSTGRQILPDESIGTIATAQYHQSMCAAAAEAVTCVPAARRELNALTITLTEAQATKAAGMIYKLCEELMAMQDDTVKAQASVFQVNLQLFAHTKPQGKK